MYKKDLVHPGVQEGGCTALLDTIRECLLSTLRHWRHDDFHSQQPFLGLPIYLGKINPLTEHKHFMITYSGRAYKPNHTNILVLNYLKMPKHSGFTYTIIKQHTFILVRYRFEPLWTTFIFRTQLRLFPFYRRKQLSAWRRFSHLLSKIVGRHSAHSGRTY